MRGVAKKIKTIESSLRCVFPKAKIQIYELEDGFRIRIVDKSFIGLDIVQREEHVFPILEKLDYELFSAIDMLLLRALREKRRTFLDEEFEHPARSLA